MYERRVEGCSALCSSPKPSHYDDVLTSVDELLGLSTKVIEVLGHGCKHLIGDALGSTERSRRRTSAASLDPLNLRVVQRENHRDIIPVERIVCTANCFYILL